MIIQFSYPHVGYLIPLLMLIIVTMHPPIYHTNTTLNGPNIVGRQYFFGADTNSPCKNECGPHYSSTHVTQEIVWGTLTIFLEIQRGRDLFFGLFFSCKEYSMC